MSGDQNNAKEKNSEKIKVLEEKLDRLEKSLAIVFKAIAELEGAVEYKLVPDGEHCGVKFDADRDDEF